jgi:hypothetical protein
MYPLPTHRNLGHAGVARMEGPAPANTGQSEGRGQVARHQHTLRRRSLILDSPPQRLFEVLSAMIAKRRGALWKIGFVSPILVEHRKKRVVTTDEDGRSRPLSRTTPPFSFALSHVS